MADTASGTGKRPLYARRFKGLNPRYKPFGICLIFHFLLPLLPIIIEVVKTKYVSAETLTITAIVYSLGIGVSSRDELIFGFSVLCSICFATLFGFIAGKQGISVPHIDVIVWTGIVIIVACHLMERWNRHVYDGEPYFEFYRRKEGSA